MEGREGKKRISSSACLRYTHPKYFYFYKKIGNSLSLLLCFDIRRGRPVPRIGFQNVRAGVLISFSHALRFIQIATEVSNFYEREGGTDEESIIFQTVAAGTLQLAVVLQPMACSMSPSSPLLKRFRKRRNANRDVSDVIQLGLFFTKRERERVGIVTDFGPHEWS